MALKHRVVWYGGQGSASLFTKSAKQACEDARTSPTAALLLAKCHEAYMRDAASPAYKEVFGTDAPSFPLPESLLDLPPRYHDNAVFQSITICLHQELRTVACCVAEFHSFEEWTGTVIESSGFCSGLLAACALATSSSLSQYLERAVTAFRTAFWVGLRSAAQCASISGPPSSVDRARSWNLSLVGPLDVYEDAVKVPSDVASISHFFVDVITDYSQSDFPVRVAAWIDDKTRSFCGRPDDLNRLAARIGPNARFSHIHGIYHGGDPMRKVVSEVMADLSRQNIAFPDTGELLHPIRLTSDDAILLCADSKRFDTPLIELVLDALLVHTVDWRAVANATAADVGPDRTSPLTIQCLGPNVSLMQGHLKKQVPLRTLELQDSSRTKSPQVQTNGSSEDVAIVGMAFKLPGASNEEQLWDTLVSGKTHLSKIPLSRFDLETYRNADPSSSRRMQASHGYFLDSIDSFDPSFFNLSPREARVMDPQQRLLLQTTKEALEDAGLVLDSTPSSQRESVGCWIGVATGDYEHNLRHDIDVYYSTGTLRAFLSGKISHALKLGGPSMVIDTACSSSLVSIHQACRSLQRGDCTVAIAGGVNTISAPDMYMGLGRAHFLSTTGGCRPFDKGADGYGRAEGCVLHVLKPLSTAIADNDRIHAVIRGSDINQCGASSSITHPHKGTQAKLFRQVLQRTALEPSQIDFVEAHGTGTQAGDTTEIGSLHDVFNTAREEPVCISSIKGNCGHTEAASGAAGLAKVILTLKKQCFPPQAALEELNPALASMIGKSLQIPREVQGWTRRHEPRRALLNNFGAAGSNCAMIIEEAPAQLKANTMTSRSGFPFILSAKTPAALEIAVQDTLTFLSEHQSQLTLSQICYSACARSTLYDHRIGFSCDSVESLLDRLRSADAVKSKRTTTTEKPLVFVFSGQGSLYFGMGGADLIDSTPIIGKCVEECIDMVQSMGIPNMAFYFRDSDSTELLTDAKHAAGLQCACVILEYAIATALMSWGLKPTALLGHSLGEYAALAVAKVLPIKSVLSIVAKRALLMQKHCEESLSGMIATQMSIGAANNFLKTHMSGSSLQVACDNDAKDCVIGGTLNDLDAWEQKCEEEDIKTRRLSVPYGFHTSFIEPIEEPLAEYCKDLTWSEPSIPILSNVTGTELTPEDLGSGYFAQHARSPVNFTTSIEVLQRSYNLSKGAVLDIGPQPTSLPMFRNSCATDDCPTLLSTLKKGVPSWFSLSTALTELGCAGYNINWRAVFDGITPSFVPLPGHPLITAPYFVPFRESTQQSTDISPPAEGQKRSTEFELLPWWSPEPQQDATHVFKTSLRHLRKHIVGHAVGGTPICPASVYSEMMSEAMSLKTQDRTSTYETLHMTFLSPMIYDGSKDEHEVIVRLSTDDDWSSSTVQVYSLSPGQTLEVLHCRATVLRTSPDRWSKHWAKTSAMIKRQTSYLRNDTSEEVNTFTTSVLYDIVFRRVVRYSEMYQSIRRLHVHSSSLEAMGTFELRPDALKGAYIVPPAFADTLLHAAGFVANSLSRSTEIAVCGEVDSIRIKHRDLKWDGQFAVYCSIYESSSAMFVADAYATDASGAVVGSVEGMHFKRLNLMGFQRHLSNASTQEHVEQQRTPVAPIADKPKRLPRVLPSTPRPAQHIKDRVFALVMRISGARSINADAKLSDYGIDSLLTIELKSALDKEFPSANVNVDVEDTMSQLAEAVLRQTGGEETPPSPPSPASISTVSTSSSATTVSSTPSTPVSEHLKFEAPPLMAQKSTDDVLSILSKICGVDLDNLTPQTRLESIGVDSLLSIELCSAMRSSFGKHISNAAVEKCDNVQDLLNVAAANAPAAPVVQSMSVAKPNVKTPANSDFISVLRRSKSGQAPLCIVHDGSGMSTKYGRVGDVGRTLIGISSPHFDDPDSIAPDVETMAAEYLAGIRSSTKLDSSKGVVFAGWSFGGVVAFMMAHLAASYGLQARGLILIDTPLPIRHAPLPAIIIQHISGQGAARSTLEAVRRMQDKVQAQFTANAGMLGHFDPPRTGLRGVCRVVAVRSSEIFDAHARCGIGYPWLDSQLERDVAIRRWRDELILRDDMSVLETPGNHFEVFEPAHVESLSAQVKKACEMIG